MLPAYVWRRTHIGLYGAREIVVEFERCFQMLRPMASMIISSFRFLWTRLVYSMLKEPGNLTLYLD